MVESPAQLPPDSPTQWNRPFLNLIVIGESSHPYDEFLSATKKIQLDLGKPSESKWSPRNLDVDIVAWNGLTMHDGDAKSGVVREFLNPYILSPLLHVAPRYLVGVDRTISALDLSVSSATRFHIPLWMGIVNITPDSFSDGGSYGSVDEVQARVEQMIAGGVNIIDIGAESTRPNATALTDDEEWDRLQPVLERVLEVCRDVALPPWISVDTYHPRNAERSLHLGVDIINDVTGLRDETMLALAKDCGKAFVAMHSLSVPVDPNVGLDPIENASDAFLNWIEQSRQLWESKGLDLDKIIIDPGIGFGKSALQSLQLMRSIRRFRQQGFRVLVGHSRKRHLTTFSAHEGRDLDIETIGASLNLCAQNVDILRVHDVERHARAYLSWAHLLDNTVAFD